MYVLECFQMTCRLPPQALMKNQKIFCGLNITFILPTHSHFKFLALHLYMQVEDKEWCFHIVILFLIASSFFCQIYMHLFNLIAMQ